MSGFFDEYLARVRRRGERKYTVVKRVRSEKAAYRALADAMTDRQWKCGDVIGCDKISWFEPSVLVEMKR